MKKLQTLEQATKDLAQYESPRLAVDIILFRYHNKELDVLLLQRKNAPFKNAWAVPGGFVRIDESVEDAALRELQEETGVKDIYIEQLYTFGDIQRDPRGRVVSIAYFGLINDDIELTLHRGEEAKDLQWHSVQQLPQYVFDHNSILEYALLRLRYKVEYTTIGFELLPEKFTLTELQELYQTVLDKEIDKRNFRKKIDALQILHETKEFRTEGLRRPAKLYTLKKEKKRIIVEIFK